MKGVKTFQLETPRLSLIPFSLADADRLHRMWNEPGVRKYLWDDKTVSMETVYEVIESSISNFTERGFGFWTIRLRNEPGIIGFCGFRQFEFDNESSGQNETEILYGLSAKHWGKGLATEASWAMLQFGFEELKLESIFAGADPPNQASFRVMENLGMHSPQHRVTGGLEAIYYVIHCDDFPANASFYLFGDLLPSNNLPEN